MHTWITLLRGINVGGKNILPMAHLRQLLIDLGYRNPKTYIQSGNCVFQTDGDDTDEHAAQIRDAIAEVIHKRFGFVTAVLVLTVSELNKALIANPYAQQADDPKTVHLFFLSGPVDQADFTKLDSLRKSGESYSLVGRVLYLYAPDGIGRSKLAASIEGALAVPTTARNLRSAMQIAELAAAC